MTYATVPVVAGAEPFAAGDGSIGVLLCHGFTGSPASMRPWAQHLAELGHTVRVPLLPGHGTRWQDLEPARWQDWYAEVDNALTALHESCDQVVVAGLSMGGALALRLAEQRPTDVVAVVLVNPAINLAGLAIKLVPVLQWIVPSVKGIGNDISQPGRDEIAYDRTPLRAMASQLALWKDVRDHLAAVNQPLLMFRSEADHVVDGTSEGLVRAGVSSDVTEFVTLHDSFHVATLDHDAPLIFERTAAFIAEHVGVPR